MNDQVFNILLIEDNLGDAFLLKQQLEPIKRFKFTLDHVDYLQNAIAHLQQQDFDIVLLDLTLPDSHGIETFLQIQETNSHIPVILLTGVEDNQLATEAIHQGAQDYLIKGQITGELVVQAIRYAIERKQNQEQLEQQIQELEGFSSMVSHDLRNPLTVIKGMSFLLQESYSKPDVQQAEREKEYVEYIIDACSRMESIIKDLTVLSQVKHTQLRNESVDISALVEQITHQLQLQEPERQVEFVITPQVIAHGHTSLLIIALENLLNNAWKYTGKKDNPCIEFGTLSIPAQNLKLKHPHGQNFIHSEKVLSGDQPIYFVRDNGTGFNPKKADKLFTPFQRLHPNIPDDPSQLN